MLVVSYELYILFYTLYFSGFVRSEFFFSVAPATVPMPLTNHKGWAKNRRIFSVYLFCEQLCTPFSISKYIYIIFCVHCTHSLFVCIVWLLSPSIILYNTYTYKHCVYFRYSFFTFSLFTCHILSIKTFYLTDIDILGNDNRILKIYLICKYT